MCRYYEKLSKWQSRGQRLPQYDTAFHHVAVRRLTLTACNLLSPASRIIEQLAEHQRVLNERPAGEDECITPDLLLLKSEFQLLRIMLVRPFRSEIATY
jgi:hypothetical protein